MRRYKDRRYAMQTYDEPPTIENYRGHPFLASLEEPAADDAGENSPEDTVAQSSEEQQQQRAAADAAPPQWTSPPAQRRSFGLMAGPGGRAASPALRPHRCLLRLGTPWMSLHQLSRLSSDA